MISNYADYLVWLIVVLLPIMIFSLFAQSLVTRTFSKYSKISSKNGWIANEMSKMLLEKYGCSDVSVQPISGRLTDNFNPKTMTLNLSEAVYNSDSVAALGVAAHETGHAVQHVENYIPLKLRSFLVPVVNIGSRLAIPLVLIGFLLTLFINTSSPISEFLFSLGIIAYSLTTVFALITLPVEINASNRAARMMLESGVVDKEEAKQVKKVLNAAALTYVATLAVSIAYLLRFIMVVASMRKSD